MLRFKESEEERERKKGKRSQALLIYSELSMWTMSFSNTIKESQYKSTEKS